MKARVLAVLAGCCLLAAGLAPVERQATADAGSTAVLARRGHAHARVHDGELVQLAGCPADIELLEDLAVAVRQQGSDPLITLGSDRLARRLYDDVPARLDAHPDAFGLKLAGIVDARIQCPLSAPN